MSDLRTAAQQALEALEEIADEVFSPYDNKLGDAILALRAALAQQDEPEAYGYASRLAVAIWEKHYKDIAPQWKPLDDLMGVLTQIDNMTSGLTLLAQQDEPKPMSPEQRQRWEELAAMPQQAESVEPVAWMLPGSDSIITAETKAYRGMLAENWTLPLYAAPPRCPNCAALAQQDEPVARSLTEDERAAIEYFALNPSMAVLAFSHWLRRDKSAPLQRLAEPVEPAFHGFMSDNGTQVDVCFSPSAPRKDGTYATAYYTAPPHRVAQQAEPLNLSDPAVQKRLATQWGYVPAAQAEPVEPVAWYRPSIAPDYYAPVFVEGAQPPAPLTQAEARLLGWRPLVPPQRAEPVEPVAGVVLNEEGRAALVEHGREEWHCVSRNARRLYTAPPQRKPLTKEEIESCRQQGFAHAGLGAPFDFGKAARAVERAVWEKNHG